MSAAQLIQNMILLLLPFSFRHEIMPV